MQRKRFRNAFSILAAAMLCMAQAAFADDAKPAGYPPEYRIGIEDVLDIGLRNDTELQKVVPVRPDGKISLPLVNDVVAAGLTPMELRDVLKEKLATYVHNPEVSVVVREIHSYKVSVLGSVKTPGRYELKGPSTVLDALALAGGFTEFAARRRITILRPEVTSVQRVHFDYDAAVKKDGTNSMFVRPGDVIIVP
jgi:polysaccharide biosynthesis/export protein